MHVTIANLVTEARTRVRELSPAGVEAHLLARDALLVDLREPEERREHGAIAGSVHAPRGLLEFRADPSSPLHRPEFDPDRRTILYCATGDRSALAAEALQRLGYRDVAHLAGGLQAWTGTGLPVVGLAPWHEAPVTT